jgi:hypothetical protein
MLTFAAAAVKYDEQSQDNGTAADNTDGDKQGGVG